MIIIQTNADQILSHFLTRSLSSWVRAGFHCSWTPLMRLQTFHALLLPENLSPPLVHLDGRRGWLLKRYDKGELSKCSADNLSRIHIHIYIHVSSCLYITVCIWDLKFIHIYPYCERMLPYPPFPIHSPQRPQALPHSSLKIKSISSRMRRKVTRKQYIKSGEEQSREKS